MEINNGYSFWFQLAVSVAGLKVQLLIQSKVIIRYLAGSKKEKKQLKIAKNSFQKISLIHFHKIRDALHIGFVIIWIQFIIGNIVLREKSRRK